MYMGWWVVGEGLEEVQGNKRSVEDQRGGGRWGIFRGLVGFVWDLLGSGGL